MINKSKNKFLGLYIWEKQLYTLTSEELGPIILLNEKMRALKRKIYTNKIMDPKLW